MTYLCSALATYLTHRSHFGSKSLGQVVLFSFDNYRTLDEVLQLVCAGSVTQRFLQVDLVVIQQTGP